MKKFEFDSQNVKHSNRSAASCPCCNTLHTRIKRNKTLTRGKLVASTNCKKIEIYFLIKCEKEYPYQCLNRNTRLTAWSRLAVRC